MTKEDIVHTRYKIEPTLPKEPRVLTSLYPHGRLKPLPEDDFVVAPEAQEAVVGPLTYQKLGHLIKRPYVLMALGVVCSVGAGMCLLTAGYFFTGAAKAPGEAVAMLASAPEPAVFADLETEEVIELIDRTQKSADKVDETLPEKAAIKVPQEEEALAMLGAQPELNVVPTASGRPDPFAPLVQEAAPGQENVAQEVEKDILSDVVYSGFIKDVNSARNTAIIKVAGTSVIKKAGDAFYVDGTKVLIKSVSKGQISLKVNGGTRTLPISVTYETASIGSTGSTGSSSTSGSSTSSGGSAASGSGSSSDSSKDEGGSASSNKKDSILKLEEM